MSKNIFDRVELGGINYNVVVSTKFGSTLCSTSGDLIFHSKPILTHGINDINSYRDSGTESGMKRERNQTSDKRRR